MDGQDDRVPELELPTNLVDAAGHDTHDRRREWIDQLPGVVADLADRWGLRLESPFQPGGQTAWVAPARTADGRGAVLKVGWTHDEGRDEAQGLRAWGGRGTVLLHADLVDGDTTALLLEQARPGTGLDRSLPEEEQDVVVAGLLQRLWVHPPPGHGFRNLAGMCEAWAQEHEDDPRRSLDPGLSREGLALWRELPTTAGREVLLLTDLHAGNVLAAEREPWLVIDPKPYVGDPAYDPLQHLLNCPDRLHADPVALTHRMAGLCGVDSERLRLWLFARCVVESAWWPELAAVAPAVAPG
jgi:streptomycin 6-kinase